MPDSEVSQARTESQRQNRGRNRGHRRGRLGGNRPQVNGSRPGADSASSQSDAPRSQPGPVATQTPPQAHISDSPRTESSNPGSRGRRGRNRPSRGQRQSERGELASRDAPRPPAHRAFGGHLTSAVAENDSDYGPSIVAPSLSGDAPEFVPGQPVVPRKKSSRPRVPTQPKAKPAKSMADDLGTRIHEDVANLNYECAICTDDVSRTSHIWSCTLCWTVVHLKCVKRWYGNQKKQQDLQSAEPQMEFSWRRARSRGRPVRIRAPFNATPGHVLHVAWWDQLSLASAGKTNLASSAERPTMRTDGAAKNYVEIFFHAGSTFARSLAILDCAENVT
ncbi:hypothetical protein EsDP_00004547 [Epichloe bromicola]|uniref:Uncharacterized protein n=1 Tax=Epichloe bromicola TaxID=79588 RepID=A0ABQ0CS27_9HYPO